MTTTTIVTPMQEEDVENTHNLLYAILEELHLNDTLALKSYKSQFTLSRMKILTSDSNASCWVAKENNRVVGFGIGRLSAGVGFVNWMGVLKNRRKKGIASKVLNQMEEDFINRGCHKAELYTYQNNEELQQFYKKRGYQAMARLNNHYFGLNVIYMTKDL